MQTSNTDLSRTSLPSQSSTMSDAAPAQPQSNKTTQAPSPTSIDSIVSRQFNPSMPNAAPSTQAGLQPPQKRARTSPRHAELIASDVLLDAARRLEARRAQIAQLLQLGFTQAQLDAMAAQNIRGDLFATLANLAPQLIALGYRQDVLAEVGLADGCQKAWTSLALHTPKLLEDGFQFEYISQITPSGVGSHTLAAMLSFAPDIKLSHTEIIAVGLHVPALKAGGFSQADILKVAGNSGGAKAIEALKKHAPALRNAGLSNADIIKVAGNGGGAQAMAALGQHAATLRKAGFSNPDIIKVAGTIGGPQAMAALGQHAPTLREAGFSNTGIIKVAGNHGGSKALVALIENYLPWSRAGFTSVEIIEAASRIGSARIFQLLALNMPQLIAFPLTTQEILVLAKDRRLTWPKIKAWVDEHTRA